MTYTKSLRDSRQGLLTLARLIQRRYNLKYSYDIYKKLREKYKML